MNDTEIKNMAYSITTKIKKANDQIRDLLIGKKAKIVSDFNGQPFGHSKNSLKGMTFTVKDVTVGSDCVHLWDGNYDHCCIGLGEVEFVEGE